MIFQADMTGKGVPGKGTAKHRKAEVRRKRCKTGLVDGERPLKRDSVKH